MLTWQEFVTISFFSIVGVLVRIGFQKGFVSDDVAVPLTSVETVVPNSPVYADYFSNAFGSFLIGLFITHTAWFKNRYPSLFVGLTSGLCGSITTFSGWVVSAAVAFMRAQYITWLLTLWFGLVVSLTSVYFGLHFGSLLSFLHSSFLEFRSRRAHSSSSSSLSLPDLKEIPAPSSSSPSSDGHGDGFLPSARPHSDRTEEEGGLSPANSAVQESVAVTIPQLPGIPKDPFPLMLTLLLLLAACIVVFIVLLAVLSASFSLYSKSVLWSCLFAPPGALLRALLLQRNLRHPTFPLYTFLVNISGALLLCVLFIIESGFNLFALNTTSAAVVMGLGTGFCGCYTTVSTFVNELRLLPLVRAYLYAFLSIAVSQVLLIVIFLAVFGGDGIPAPILGG